MDDHNDSGGSRDGRGDDRDRERRPGGEGGDRDRGGPRSDTRFLQLEMSQLLYSEAEAVTRPAFRELLLEAAKDRLRERFGEEITALANLAVDEALNDMQASFDVEARIQQYGDERRRPFERLQEIVGARRARGESRPARAGRPQRRTSARAKKRR